jgi:hypothetical protein
MSDNIGGYQPHQERVIAEKADLDERLQKLAAFMGGEVFDALPEEDRYLMQLQSSVMLSLSMLLGKRIERFAPAPPPRRVGNLGGFAAMYCACGAVPVLETMDYGRLHQVGCVCGSNTSGTTPFLAVRAWNKLQQEQGG